MNDRNANTLFIQNGDTEYFHIYHLPQRSDNRTLSTISDSDTRQNNKRYTVKNKYLYATKPIVIPDTKLRLEKNINE